MELTALLPFTTGRLVVRPFTPDDLDDLHAYWSLKSFTRYLYRPTRTREQCAEFIAEIARPVWEKDGDKLVLAVCRRDAPGVVGEVVLKYESARARQAEIGWGLHPDHTGHGYATEAARALAVRAFDALGAHRLFARIDVENVGSSQICERLGMRKEAHLVENDLDGDRWGSEFVYAALEGDLKRMG